MTSYRVYVCARGLTGNVPSTVEAIGSLKNVSPKTLVSCIILRTQQGSLAENVERLAHHNARTLASVQPFLAGHASGTISVPLPATSSGRSPDGSNACRLPGTTDQGSDRKKKKGKDRAIAGSSPDACECDSCSRSTRQAQQLIRLALWVAGLGGVYSPAEVGEVTGERQKNWKSFYALDYFGCEMTVDHSHGVHPFRLTFSSVGKLRCIDAFRDAPDSPGRVCWQRGKGSPHLLQQPSRRVV